MTKNYSNAWKLQSSTLCLYTSFCECVQFKFPFVFLKKKIQLKWLIRKVPLDEIIWKVLVIEDTSVTYFEFMKWPFKRGNKGNFAKFVKNE